MDESFNPYLKWLGISLQDQPANHYRLLGIPELIDDCDVIDNAASRQMAHVRTFATGEHSQLSQKLLNELAAAKIALLNSATKAAYDQQLAMRLKPVTVPTPPPYVALPRVNVLPPKPIAALGQVPQTVQAPPAFHPEFTKVGQRYAGETRLKQRTWIATIVVLAGITLLVGVLFGSRNDKRIVADSEKNPAPPKVPPVSSPTTTSEQPKPSITPKVATEVAQTPPLPEVKEEHAPEAAPAEHPPSQVPPQADADVEQDPTAKPGEPKAEEPPKGATQPKPGPLAFHIAPHAKPVDLLKSLSQHKFEGSNSRLDDEGLVVSRSGSLRIPYVLPETYVLKVTAQQLGADRLANVYLQMNIGGYRAFLGMEGTRDKKKYVWGLHLKDTYFMENATTVEGPFFEPGVANTVFIFVRKDGVRVVCNGHQVLEYEGDLASLGDYFKPEYRFVHVDWVNYDYRLRELLLYEPAAVVESSRIVADDGSANPPADAAQKPPMPTAEQQATSLQEVRKLFAAEYKKARTAAEKFELAQVLYNASLQSHEDPVACYVLIVEAKDLAVAAGKVDAAMQMVDALEQVYASDTLAIRLAALTELGRSNQSLAVHLPVTNHALRAVEMALASSRFVEANALVEIAQASARRAKDPTLIKHVAAVGRRQTQLDQAYCSAQSAFEVLKQDPADPAANLAAGKYVCFHLNDWQRGLALLAKSSDASCQSAAQQEQADPQSVEAIEKLGDTWWGMAEKSTLTTETAACRTRAAHWYQKGLPEFKGLTKVKIEKRLAEINQQTP